MSTHAAFLVALSCAALASTAGAHPWVVPAGVDSAETDPDARFYVFWDAVPQLWQESNGKLDRGVQSYANSNTPYHGDSGLQMHDVCYGTFTEEDVDAWNVATGHYSAEERLLNYVPYEGTPEACAAAGGVFTPRDTPLTPDANGLV